MKIRSGDLCGGRKNCYLSGVLVSCVHVSYQYMVHGLVKWLVDLSKSVPVQHILGSTDITGCKVVQG